MKNYRSGWYGENYRHYLASKGVITSKYLSKKQINAIKYVDAPKGAAYDKVGIDSKGRRVRLYSKEHKEEAAKSKFKRLQKLQKKYPVVLNKIEQDVNSKNKETRDNARATYIILKTGLRPGSYKDTKGDVQAYGLSTLKSNQVTVTPPNTVNFKFTGKKGVQVKKKLVDSKVAKIVVEQKKLKDEELFPNVTDDSLRKYVRRFGDYKTKDLRTLYANQVAKKYEKKGSKEAVQKVADALQNTPGVAKGAYIAPDTLA